MLDITLKETRAYQEIKEEGRQEERELALQRERSLILRLLNKQLGELNETLPDRVLTLSFQQLELLGETLLDFTSTVDLKA